MIAPWSRFWFVLSVLILVGGMLIDNKWWLLAAWIYLWIGAIIQDRANQKAIRRSR